MGMMLKFVKDGKGLKDQVILTKDKVISYEEIRDAVGGYIEFVYYVDLGDEGIVIIVDEESLLKQLEPTFWLYSEKKGTVNQFPLVGNVLVVRVDGENTVSLNLDDINLVKSKIMVDKEGKNYFLPLNDEYIDSSNEFINEFFNIIDKSE